LKGLIQKHNILERLKAWAYISKSFSNCKKRYLKIYDFKCKYLF